MSELPETVTRLDAYHQLDGWALRTIARYAAQKIMEETMLAHGRLCWPGTSPLTDAIELALIEAQSIADPIRPSEAGQTEPQEKDER